MCFGPAAFPPSCPIRLCFLLAVASGLLRRQRSIFKRKILTSRFFCALINARRLSRNADASDASKQLLFLVPLLVFVLVQSFFERQLLAVGNPASLLMLVVFVSLSLRSR